MTRPKWLVVIISLMVIAYYGLALFSERRPLARILNSDPFVCRFEGKTESGRPFEFNLPENECQWVGYNGSNVIRVNLQYPSMKVVRPQRRVNDSSKDSSIVFWITQITIDSYRENAIIAGILPISIFEGVETYGEAGKFKRFIARDGRSVFAHSVLDVISVTRVFDSRFRVKYMYSKKYTDIKVMDEFALGFLEKIIIR